VIPILKRFVVSREMHQFLSMLPNKTAGQLYDSCRIPVPDPSTGLASMPIGTGRLQRRPLPASVLKNGAAGRANGRFGQFGRSLIRIVNVLAYKSVPSRPRGSVGFKMHRDLILKADTASRLHALQKFGIGCPAVVIKSIRVVSGKFEGKRPNAPGC
jgi:hypothetical protein